MSDELNAKLNTVNDVYTIHLHVDCFHVMFQPASVVVLHTENCQFNYLNLSNLLSIFNKYICCITLQL